MVTPEPKQRLRSSRALQDRNVPAGMNTAILPVTTQMTQPPIALVTWISGLVFLLSLIAARV